MNEYVIDFIDVKYSYPNSSRDVINIAEFKLKKNEKLFLYGPSGCGKSTLLGIAAGVLTATHGITNVFSQNFAKIKPSVRDKIRGLNIGYIFQMFNLVPYLSVFENILLPTSFNKQKILSFGSEKKFIQEAEYLCSVFKIDQIKNSKVTDISIGQQQRVAAARALLGSPQLIIADEPTSALDTNMREVFITTLLEQCHRQNTAVLFVSHDNNLASFFDRKVSLPEINRLS
jgi:putative ABC transport system ATP-binding protein